MNVKAFLLLLPFKTQEPVETIGIVALFFHPFFGHTARPGRRNDGVFSGTPVGRSRDVIGIGLLKGLDHPFDLIEVSTRGLRIVEDEPDFSFGVDNENGTDRLRIGLTRLDHPVLFGHFHGDVFDQGEGHFDVFQVFPLQFFDATEPGNMSIQRVDGKADQFGVQRLEFVNHAGKSHELGGAYRGEIGGMRE